MKIPGPGIGSEFGVSKSGGYQLALYGEPMLAESHRVTLVANGRAALGLVIRYLRQAATDRSDRVLLPAYLCHSMIQPFMEHGLQVDFYPIDGGFSFNPTLLLERLQDTTLAVMTMHYFGFGQTEDPIIIIREQFPHVAIIDDRTHMLVSDLKAGNRVSDQSIAVYSPRKWGAFPDLGIVIWPGAFGEPAEVPHLLDRGYDLGFALWRLLGVFLRTLFFVFPSDKLRSASLYPFHKADALLDRRVQVRAASPVSRLLWHFWNWSEVWHRRRENFQYLLSHWPTVDIVPLCRELPDTVCPLGFPIRTQDRDRLLQYLVSKGIFPPIHWVRPSDVSPAEFPEAAELAEQELTIPVDQRYGIQHMEYILETICRA